MYAVIRPEDTWGVLAGVTGIYLVLVFLIVRRTQTLEVLFLALGLVTALLAVWCGQLGAHGAATVHVGPGQGGVFLGGDVAGTIGRIALLLVLAGVAVGIVSQWNSPIVSPGREEAFREHKS